MLHVNSPKLFFPPDLGFAAFKKVFFLHLPSLFLVYLQSSSDICVQKTAWVIYIIFPHRGGWRGWGVGVGNPTAKQAGCFRSSPFCPLGTVKSVTPETAQESEHKHTRLATSQPQSPCWELKFFLLLSHPYIIPPPGNQSQTRHNVIALQTFLL